MKRILLMVFRNLWFVPWAWCKLCYRASHTDKYTEEEQYSFIRWVDLHANKGGNVKIDVHGSENIPAENGFMFFPNHQGLYDVLAMIEACPRPFSVVAKKEVGNIPFLKQVFSCLKAFLLDREDVRQAMKVIIDVSKEVEKGRNYLIFPEGTRTPGDEMLEFKEGSFKIAEKSGCAIIPLSLNNTIEIFEAHLPRIKKTHVIIEYGAPIYPKDLDRETRKHLDTYVSDIIRETIRKNAALV